MKNAVPEALAAELAALTERLRAATVSVRGPRPGASAGAGVVWRPGLIVTAAHVVAARAPFVRTADGTVVRAELLARDRRRDLALLGVAPELARPAEVAPSLPPVGALVVAVGDPLGLSWAVSAGIVYGFATPRRTPLLLADLQLFPGNSGGPLADASGRVVGVNVMIIRGVAAAIPSTVVEQFLDRAQAA